MDEFDDFEELDDTLTQQDTEEIESDGLYDYNDLPEIVDSLLADKGIEDKSSIKFENESGEIEEKNWDDLSNSEKLEILRTNDSQPTSFYSDLDDSELQLINSIRSSNMTPQEYMNYVQQTTIDNYINNILQPHYSVDDLSDDDLYMTDVLSKRGADNITAEELADKLLAARLNEEFFNEYISELRNNYRAKELADIQSRQMYEQQTQVENFNRFAETVENEIRNFTDFGGFDLDMSEDEMEELYDFITGFDLAGVSTFSKVLNDPKYLVRMAWFALNGDKAMQDINDYWTNELKTSRKNNRTLKDKVTIKKPKESSNEYDDLDDF